MNIRDLQYVEAVAELRNFTRAAAALNVSQPALSSQIRKLEKELGVEVFERRQDGVVPTTFGLQLVIAAREVTSIVDRIKETAQHFREIDATPLRLGLTPTLAAYLSRYFIEMLAQLFPDLRLIVVEEKPIELARLVESQQIDIALISRLSHRLILGNEGQNRMAFTPIWLEPLFLGVGKGHWLAEAPGIAARDVPSDLLIRFDVPFGYDLEEHLPTPDPRSAERVGIDVRSARFETVCRHVAQSDACTIINAIAAHQFMRDQLGLELIPFTGPGNLRELGIISRPNYSRMLVVERIQAYIQETPPPGTIACLSDPQERETAVAALIADMSGPDASA